MRRLIIVCDGCGSSLTPDMSAPVPVVSQASAAGWHIGEHDYCYLCAEEKCKQKKDAPRPVPPNAPAPG